MAAVQERGACGWLAFVSLGEGWRGPGCWYVSRCLSLFTLARTILPDYPFAKYNVQTSHYVYSQDEYSRLLEGSVAFGDPACARSHIEAGRPRLD